MSTMPDVLRAGDVLRFGGRSWILAHHDGRGNMTLRDPDTDERLHTTAHELANDNHDPSTVRVLAGLQHDPWLPHVLEVIDGTPIGEGPRRPEYQEGAPMMARYEAKSRELMALGFKHASKDTVRRKVSKYRNKRAAGLIDGRTTRVYDPWDKVDPFVKFLCEEVYAEYRVKSSTSLKHRAAVVRQRFRKQRPDDIAVLPRPRKVQKLLKTLERGVGLSGSAKTRRTEDAAAEGPYGQHGAPIPGASVEIDSTPAEVLVRCSDGQARRPTLMVMIDIATRAVLAINVTLKPDGPEIAEMLADACSIPKMRPIAYEPPYVRELTRLPHQWARYADSEFREEIDDARPRVPIINLTTDRGADYMSESVKRICTFTGTTIWRAAPRSPTDKPHVERVMDTIRENYLQPLPGYVGNGTEFRGSFPDKEEYLDLDVFAYLIDYLIANVYNNTTHSGLWDKRFPDAGLRLSPNAAYAMYSENSAWIFRPLPDDIWILAQRAENRKITRGGVRHQKVDYSSAELVAFFNSSGHVPDTSYQVFYRPRDPSRIWVLIEALGKFITCTPPVDRWELANLDSWNNARAAAEAYPMLSRDDADDQVLDIADAFVNATPQERRRRFELEDERRLRFAQGRPNIATIRPYDPDRQATTIVGHATEEPPAPAKPAAAPEPAAATPIVPAPRAFQRRPRK